MRLSEFDDKPCPYCGRLMCYGGSNRDDFPSRDHVLARSQGGSAILVVCYSCNSKKGRQNPYLFMKTLMGCDRTRTRIAMIGALHGRLGDKSPLKALSA